MPFSSINTGASLGAPSSIARSSTNETSSTGASTIKPKPRARKSTRTSSSNSDVLLYFLAIFVPPIAVLLKRGCGGDFLINILLTILGWIPGCIHAWLVVSKREHPAALQGR